MNEQSRAVDVSTILGITLAISVIVLAIYLGGGHAKGFYDLSAILIVIVGTFFVTTACFSIKDMMNVFPVTLKMIFFHVEEPEDSAIRALMAADLVRKKGHLAIEETKAEYKDNAIYNKGAMLISDNAPAETIEKVLNEEISSSFEQYARVVSVLRKSGEISPAMGLIGTLIGLVQMLSNLQDVTKIGPSMAIALLTTFYGATLSYVFFYPLASKVERNAKEELLSGRIYQKAFLSISRKENPRQLETLINSLLSSKKSVKYFDNN